MRHRFVVMGFKGMLNAVHCNFLSSFSSFHVLESVNFDSLFLFAFHRQSHPDATEKQDGLAGP